jgi:hypothetical protein
MISTVTDDLPVPAGPVIKTLCPSFTLPMATIWSGSNFTVNLLVVAVVVWVDLLGAIAIINPVADITHRLAKDAVVIHSVLLCVVWTTCVSFSCAHGSSSSISVSSMSISSSL